MPFSGATRLIIINKNVPKMVGQITSVLAEKSINIADMLNRQQGDYAYNIIDIDGNICEGEIERIKSVSIAKERLGVSV